VEVKIQFGTRWQFYAGEPVFGTDFVGNWVDPNVGLDVVAKRQNPPPPGIKYRSFST